MVMYLITYKRYQGICISLMPIAYHCHFAIIKEYQSAEILIYDLSGMGPGITYKQIPCMALLVIQKRRQMQVCNNIPGYLCVMNIDVFPDKSGLIDLLD